MPNDNKTGRSANQKVGLKKKIGLGTKVKQNNFKAIIK